MSTIACAWCGDQFDGELLACPRCGAPAASAPVADGAGWVEAPAVPDMAKLQFGASRAQIEGTTVPVVDVELAAGDSVFCSHDKLLWHDGTADLHTKKIGNVFKSFKAGIPLILLEATGPGRIAFSDNAAGELVPIPLDAGETINCVQSHLLLATSMIGYDGQLTRAWYETVEIHETDDGKEYETERHHPFGEYHDTLQASADAPGLIILHGVGNVYRRRLGAGESVDLAPHALLAWKGGATAEMVLQDNGIHLHGMHLRDPTYEHFYLAVRMTGPGDVWIQSGNHGETEGWDRVAEWSGVREDMPQADHSF